MACPSILCIVKDKDETNFEELIESNEAYEDLAFWGITGDKDVYWYHLIAPTKSNYVPNSFVSVFCKYMPFVVMRPEGNKNIFASNIKDFHDMFIDMYDSVANKDIFVYHLMSPRERYNLLKNNSRVKNIIGDAPIENYRFMSKDDTTGETYSSDIEEQNDLLYCYDSEIELLDGKDNRIGVVDMTEQLDFSKLTIKILDKNLENSK